MVVIHQKTPSAEYIGRDGSWCRLRHAPTRGSWTSATAWIHRTITRQSILRVNNIFPWVRPDRHDRKFNSAYSESEPILRTPTPSEPEIHFEEEEPLQGRGMREHRPPRRLSPTGPRPWRQSQSRAHRADWYYYLCTRHVFMLETYFLVWDIYVSLDVILCMRYFYQPRVGSDIN